DRHDQQQAHHGVEDHVPGQTGPRRGPGLLRRVGGCLVSLAHGLKDTYRGMKEVIVIWLFALIGVITVAVLLWRAFGPASQPAPPPGIAPVVYPEDRRALGRHTMMERYPAGRLAVQAECLRCS